MKPIFFMMSGLPYSGKSVVAEKLHDKFGAIVHSSDKIREELLGDVQDQSNNAEVFSVLHKRVLSDLLAGKNVVYDATNLSYKRRMEFLQRLNKVPCQKVCLFMATPFDVCMERSKFRERVVPYDIVERMYKTVWIPYFYEGWDHIELVYPEKFEPYDVSKLFNGENGLNFQNQDNPHHALTVGHHCITTFGLISEESSELQEAALLHDIGKPFTKGFVDSKGEPCDTAHYYEHHHVSAYDSLFYANPDLDRLYIATVIQWHMRPFELERVSNSTKAKKKFKNLVGDKLYEDIMTLHKADIKAKGIS